MSSPLISTFSDLHHQQLHPSTVSSSTSISSLPKIPIETSLVSTNLSSECSQHASEECFKSPYNSLSSQKENDQLMVSNPFYQKEKTRKFSGDYQTSSFYQSNQQLRKTSESIATSLASTTDLQSMSSTLTTVGISTVEVLHRSTEIPSLSENSEINNIGEIKNIDEEPKKDTTIQEEIQTKLMQDQSIEMLTIPQSVILNHSIHRQQSVLYDSSTKGPLIESSLTSISTPPCGVNRWITLILGLLITASTGSFFFNWPTTQTMLINSEAYTWLCRDGNFISSSHRNENYSAKKKPVELFSSSVISDLSQSISDALGGGSSFSEEDWLSHILAGFGPTNIVDNVSAGRYLLSSALIWLLGGTAEEMTLGKNLKAIDESTASKDVYATHIRRFQVNGDRPILFRRNLQIDTEQGSYQRQSFPCTKQIQSINSLMPIGIAAWLLFSLLGGISMDIFGPRLTSITGLILSASGWIALAFCSEHLPLYRVSFGLIGSGVDVVFIGIINISNLFPSYRGTIISIFHAARSLAFGIPSLFNLIIKSTSGLVSFRIACILYTGIFGIWCLVVCAFVPKRPFPNVKGPLIVTKDKKENESYLCPNCRTKLQAESSSTVTELEPMVLLSSLDQQQLEQYLNNQNSMASTNSCTSCGHQRHDDGHENNQTDAAVDDLHSQSTCGWERASRTLHFMRSASYYPLLPFASLTVLRGSFLSNSARDQLGRWVHFFTILTPLSFLPAPIFGFLADKLSIHFVFLFLNSLGCTQFLLLFFFPTVSTCLALVTLLNLFIASFFLGQFYCYITLLFPSEFTGTLVGITISFSGLFGLLVTPMYNYSINSQNFQVMNGICLGFILCCYFFIFLLWRASKKVKK